VKPSEVDFLIQVWFRAPNSMQQGTPWHSAIDSKKVDEFNSQVVYCIAVFKIVKLHCSNYVARQLLQEL